MIESFDIDKIILYCGSVGLRVVLVRVSSKSGNAKNEVSWYIPTDSYYTEQQFINDWTMLALRYKGTAVIGADLWNEPRNGVTWGTGTITDWNKAAERVGNAILKSNPQWIIFVQGLSQGRDLTCVRTQQIKFSVNNKLVYSFSASSTLLVGHLWSN
jgi:aryl-phospho-beta-D-glucosidase BglC (GH1 family)